MVGVGQGVREGGGMGGVVGWEGGKGVGWEEGVREGGGMGGGVADKSRWLAIPQIIDLKSLDSLICLGEVYLKK